MVVDLVEATMRDGLRLHGALHVPPVPASQETSARSLDAVLCLHGTGSNFYSSSLMAGLVPRLLQWPVNVLTVNTRGHDGINWARGMPERPLQGSALEIVDECRHDVAGWVAWLVNRGFQRIGLLGHSLGALKALYALAHEPQPDVRVVMALSPPRLSYEAFQQTPRGKAFLEEYELARAKVDAGQGDQLLSVRFPIPYVVTAQGYVDKYGPDERYNLLKFAAAVACPVLVTYGTAELNGIAFRGVPEELQGLPNRGGRLDVAVLAGADHQYAGMYAELEDRLRRWLYRVVGSTEVGDSRPPTDV
jgi:pimeloyl-ACP methyl ester carboxylesterase